MTRNASRLSGLGLIALLAFAPPLVQAQGPGGGGPGGGGRGFGGPGGFGGRGGNASEPMAIINNEAVQAELELTDKQKAKLKEFSDARNQGRRQIGQTVRQQMQQQAQENGGQFDRQAMGEAMQTAMATFEEESAATFNKILTKPQRIRLNQISLQAQGALAVAKPEVAQKLNLGPTQIDAIQEIVTTMGQQQRELFMGLRNNGGPGGGGPGGGARAGAGGGGNGNANDPAANGGGPGSGGQGGGRGGRGNRPDFNDPAVQEQFAKLRTDSEAIKTKAVAKIGKILKPNQKAAWKKMLGEPFDVAQLRPNFGTGRGNPPGGPNGPGGAQPKGEDTKATKSASRPAA